MPRIAIKQNRIPRRRAPAQGDPKRLGLLILRHQLEQRLFEKHYESSHRVMLADEGSEAKVVIVRWCQTQQEDAPALSAFVDAYLRDDWFLSLTSVQDRIRHDVSLLGWHGARLIVWGCLSSQAILYNLLVDPAYRGTKIGQQALRFLQPQVVRSMRNMSSGDPRAFYTQLGYRDSGLRTGRKGNIDLLVSGTIADESR